jgi:hypothetical protein
MNYRTHFAHRVDMWDDADNVVEHLAGVEDFELAVATYLAACRRWPGAAITLRQGARRNSRSSRLITSRYLDACSTGRSAGLVRRVLRPRCTVSQLQGRSRQPKASLATFLPRPFIFIMGKFDSTCPRPGLFLHAV